MSGHGFSGKKVLITGGIGFIGSHLAMRLVEDGATVTVIDSMMPEYGGNLENISTVKPRIAINISDVRDPYSMAYLILNHDFLFNLAGQSSHLDSMNDPFTDEEINIRAQLHILEACRRYNSTIKIIFASTRQIYGKPLRLPVDETHPIQPVDVNGINKYAGELYHILYHQVYGINTCILRLTNTYGPHMRIKDARQTFVGLWIRHLLEGKPIEVWGGDQLRDFNFVDDVVEAMILAAINDNTSGVVFNLGGDEVVSVATLAKLMVELHGKGQYAIRDYPVDRKRIDIGDYYGDYGKIHRVLGWEPKTSLHEGLAVTINFYEENIDKYL